MLRTVLEGSVSLVGYEAELFEKDDFQVIGYSALHQPDTPDFELWERLRDDGRLDLLIEASSRGELFGCSSGDSEATVDLPKGSYRHTVCIEVTTGVDLGLLKPDELFRIHIPASRWVCFNLTKERFYDGRDYHFLGDDPYGMVKRLGFRFNWSVGLHVDVFDKPDIGVFDLDDPADRQRVMHFWMPVR